MGTRNLVCVVKDGEYKVAQYGQWDGYFMGQGVTVCEFLQSADMDTFRKALDDVEYITEAEEKACWEEFDTDDSGWVTLEVSDKFGSKYPELSRDTGAGVLQLIYDGDATKLGDSLSFAGDSLMCEFAYVVNMDTEMLEIYQGFNKVALDLTERFISAPARDGYKPVKHLRDIPFHEATAQAMQDLENEMNEDYDE